MQFSKFAFKCASQKTPHMEPLLFGLTSNPLKHLLVDMLMKDVLSGSGKDLKLLCAVETL